MTAGARPAPNGIQSALKRAARDLPEGLHPLTTRELPLASENRRVGIRVEIRRYDDLRFFLRSVIGKTSDCGRHCDGGPG